MPLTANSYGGNNDFPFLRPDLHIVVVDALRPAQIATHHPGEAAARMADVAVINKVDVAPLEATINSANADVVVAATPLDLAHLIRVNKAVVRARYEFAEAGEPRLGSLVDKFLAR